MNPLDNLQSIRNSFTEKCIVGENHLSSCRGSMVTPKAIHKLFSLCTPPKELCPKHCPEIIIYGYSYLLFSPPTSDTHYHSHLKPYFTEKIEVSRRDFPEVSTSPHTHLWASVCFLCPLPCFCGWTLCVLGKANTSPAWWLLTYSETGSGCGTPLIHLPLCGIFSFSLSSCILTSCYYSHLRK